MKRKPFKINSYYHVFNRGNNKQNIFLDERDYTRFLFTILHFGLEFKILPHTQHVTNYLQTKNFGTKLNSQQIDTKIAELQCFALMPNHFHLLLKEKTGFGISKYMQRVQNSYTKYFNARHKTVGHLFQGAYKSIPVTSELQYTYVTAYIHRNPAELPDWKTNEEKYPWSSFQDYVQKNRWGKLLYINLIRKEFKNPEQYLEFVKRSGAKSTKSTSDVELHRMSI